MSQDNALSDDQIDRIPFTGFAPPKMRDHSEVEALRRFARAVIAAHLERTGQSVTNDAVPEGMVLAPHFRGYAALGTGGYVLSPCVENDTPSLVIHIATDADKANRVIGERRDTAEPGKLIQPEVIAVRLDFLSERGLFALEDILTTIRQEHFADATPPEAATAETAGKAPASVPSDATEAVLAALRLAIRQNSLDMIMTGEELRQCEAALAAQPGVQHE